MFQGRVGRVCRERMSRVCREQMSRMDISSADCPSGTRKIWSKMSQGELRKRPDPKAPYSSTQPVSEPAESFLQDKALLHLPMRNLYQEYTTIFH